MAYKLLDRVFVDCDPVGTGPLVMRAPREGYQTAGAAGAVTGDTLRYVVEEGLHWEIGWGVFDAVTSTITRNLTQSSTGALLNITEAATVFLTVVSEDIAQLDDIQTAVSGYLPLTGGAITGHLFIQGDEWTKLAIYGRASDSVATMDFRNSTGDETWAWALRAQGLSSGTFQVRHDDAPLLIINPSGRHTISGADPSLYAGTVHAGSFYASVNDGATEIIYLPVVNNTANVITYSKEWTPTQGIIQHRIGGDNTAGQATPLIGFTSTDDRGVLIDPSNRAIGMFTGGLGTTPAWITMSSDRSKLAISNLIDNASGARGLLLNGGDILNVRNIIFGGEAPAAGDYIKWVSGGTGMQGYENGVFGFQIATGTAQKTLFPPTYTRTTATAANAAILSDGELLRSTSSGVYKANRRAMIGGLDVVNNLRPTIFTSLHEGDDKNQDFLGFIAEEVAEVLPAAKTDGGQNYDTRSIVAALVSAVQELTARVKHLEGLLNVPYA